MIKSNPALETSDLYIQPYVCFFREKHRLLVLTINCQALGTVSALGMLWLTVDKIRKHMVKTIPCQPVFIKRHVFRTWHRLQLSPVIDINQRWKKLRLYRKLIRLMSFWLYLLVTHLIWFRILRKRQYSAKHSLLLRQLWAVLGWACWVMVNRVK